MLRPTLSIVIPAHNEGKRIYTTILRLFRWSEHDTMFGRKEIVIVENGITDNTSEKRREAIERGYLETQQNWPDVFTYHSEKGKGAAVKEGIKRARGTFILITDADLSTSISQVNNLYFCINSYGCEYKEKRYDLAIGSRRAPGAIVSGQSYTRRLSSWAFNQWSRILLPDIHDTQCGFKLLRWEPAQEIAERLTLTGFAYDVEMLYIARKMKYTVKEVPVKWIDSEGSKVKVVRDSIRMFSDVIRIVKNSAAYEV